MKRILMLMLVGGVLAGLLAGGCAPQADETAPEEQPAAPPEAPSATADTTRAAAWTVTPRDFGPVRFGMTLEEAARALGEPVEAGEEYAAEGCSYTRPASLPEGTSFMVIDGAVARVDVDAAGVLTARGVGVGTAEAEVLRRYGGTLRTEPHPYTGPEGHYLIYTPTDSLEADFGLIFETDGRQVVSYRAGRAAEVQYIEGCA